MKVTQLRQSKTIEKLRAMKYEFEQRNASKQAYYRNEIPTLKYWPDELRSSILFASHIYESM